MSNFNSRYNKLVQDRSANGRVSGLDNMVPKQYKLFHDINDNKCAKNYLNNVQTDSLLSNVYFSKENVKIIQNALRYQVWILSDKKYIISNQCDSQLNIIMRSIYLQYSKNLSYNIKEQVESLNKKVISYSVDNIYNNLLQYNSYTKDISTGLQVMDLPKGDSIKGNKTFRMDKFI